jgi:hypothetical protein
VFSVALWLNVLEAGNMDLIANERRSDSPFVERIWHAFSDKGGSFTSIAQPHWEMVVSRLRGKTFLTVRGPETRSSPAFAPPDAEFFGITFKPGTLMPQIPPRMLMDRCDVNLPEAGSQSFWLNGRAWQFPDVENADTFVDWLVRDGLLVYDPVVSATLQGKPVGMSLRSVQRRFLAATGLTHSTLHQIERARHAIILLKQGSSILDATYQMGYADQAHLTRSLKLLTGHTPAQIADENRPNPMSFLFNTQPF